jgi:hypothetical protein
LADSEKIIINKYLPSCRNCIYYEPSKIDKDFSSSYFSKCNKFGEKNIITDKIEYNFADGCRRDETKCGREGKFFEKEENINMKILKHNIVRNIPNILMVFIISCSVGIQVISRTM